MLEEIGKIEYTRETLKPPPPPTPVSTPSPPPTPTSSPTSLSPKVSQAPSMSMLSSAAIAGIALGCIIAFLSLAYLLYQKIFGSRAEKIPAKQPQTTPGINPQKINKTHPSIPPPLDTSQKVSKIVTQNTPFKSNTPKLDHETLEVDNSGTKSLESKTKSSKSPKGPDNSNSGSRPVSGNVSSNPEDGDYNVNKIAPEKLDKNKPENTSSTSPQKAPSPLSAKKNSQSNVPNQSSTSVNNNRPQPPENLESENRKIRHKSLSLPSKEKNNDPPDPSEEESERIFQESFANILAAREAYEESERNRTEYLKTKEQEQQQEAFKKNDPKWRKKIYQKNRKAVFDVMKDYIVKYPPPELSNISEPSISPSNVNEAPEDTSETFGQSGSDLTGSSISSSNRNEVPKDTPETYGQTVTNKKLIHTKCTFEVDGTFDSRTKQDLTNIGKDPDEYEKMILERLEQERRNNAGMYESESNTFVDNNGGEVTENSSSEDSNLNIPNNNSNDPIGPSNPPKVEDGSSSVNSSSRIQEDTSNVDTSSHSETQEQPQSDTPPIYPSNPPKVKEGSSSDNSSSRVQEDIHNSEIEKQPQTNSFSVTSNVENSESPTIKHENEKKPIERSSSSGNLDPYKKPYSIRSYSMKNLRGTPNNQPEKRNSLTRSQSKTTKTDPKKHHHEDTASSRNKRRTINLPSFTEDTTKKET